MTKRAFILASVSILITAAQAQTPRLVRATGEGLLSVKPDLAKLNVGVVTQANTAKDASAQNAAQVEAVLAQLRQLLGPNADIKTISYSLVPNYKYTPNEPPTLVGYTANNSMEVIIPDLSLIGTVIDTASDAGANNVGGLLFTIRDQEPVRQQVLGLAAKQGRAHAQAIAAGLGARVGSIFTASEGAIFSPPEIAAPGPRFAAPPTPIETGLVQVRATVTIDAELLQ